MGFQPVAFLVWVEKKCMLKREWLLKAWHLEMQVQNFHYHLDVT